MFNVTVFRTGKFGSILHKTNVDIDIVEKAIVYGLQFNEYLDIIIVENLENGNILDFTGTGTGYEIAPRQIYGL